MQLDKQYKPVKLSVAGTRELSGKLALAGQRDLSGVLGELARKTNVKASGGLTSSTEYKADLKLDDPVDEQAALAFLGSLGPGPKSKLRSELAAGLLKRFDAAPKINVNEYVGNRREYGTDAGGGAGLRLAAERPPGPSIVSRWPGIRNEGGQVLPALLVLMVSLLALGVILLQAGHATDLRANAQSAADAGALAAAKGLRQELQNQLPGSPISGALAREGAETYAERNGARLTRFSLQGRDVLVTVATRERLGDEAGASNDRPATARARARLEPVVSVGGTNLLGVAASGDGGSGGASCASPEEMKKTLEKKKPSSIVDLGRTLQGLGISVSEHPSFGGVDPVHVKGSLHYTGDAIDVNAEACGEAATFDRISPLVEKAGFGVLWRVPNHFDHAHFDTGGGGGIGSGGGSGGDTHNSYEIRLVAWEG